MNHFPNLYIYPETAVWKFSLFIRQQGWTVFSTRYTYVPHISTVRNVPSIRNSMTYMYHRNRDKYAQSITGDQKIMNALFCFPANNMQDVYDHCTSRKWHLANAVSTDKLAFLAQCKVERFVDNPNVSIYRWGGIFISMLHNRWPQGIHDLYTYTVRMYKRICLHVRRSSLR